MLLASNVFMTFAWYGHLKFKGHSLKLGDRFLKLNRGELP
jgi:uncharacterized protein (DUF486 family)